VIRFTDCVPFSRAGPKDLEKQISNETIIGVGIESCRNPLLKHSIVCRSSDIDGLSHFYPSYGLPASVKTGRNWNTMSNQILRARKRRAAVEHLTVFRDPEYLFMKRKIEKEFPNMAERMKYLDSVIQELAK
jgi:hypothetical protein